VDAIGKKRKKKKGDQIKFRRELLFAVGMESKSLLLARQRKVHVVGSKVWGRTPEFTSPKKEAVGARTTTIGRWSD